MWEFLRWFFEGWGSHIDAQLKKILEHEHQILVKQGEVKELVMAVKQTVEQHAADVNVFSDQLATSVLGVRQDIADLKLQLVDASTPAEVDAILAPALAKLAAQANALKALDDENIPSIPPIPVEPPQPL